MTDGAADRDLVLCGRVVHLLVVLDREAMLVKVVSYGAGKK
jgi:hypothetical protein